MGDESTVGEASLRLGSLMLAAKKILNSVSRDRVLELSF